MPSNPANHYPGPWRFHVHRFGFRNVVTDRDGRYIVSGARGECGPLLVAGPRLLESPVKGINVLYGVTSAHTAHAA